MTPLGEAVLEGLERWLPSDAFDKKEFVATRAGMGRLGAKLGPSLGYKYFQDLEILANLLGDIEHQNT
jgi:hypothetical protein